MKNITDEEKIANFQANLSEIRKAYGFTAKDLGLALGVSRSQISNIETGVCKMTKSQYLALIAIFSFGQDNLEEIFNNSKADN